MRAFFRSSWERRKNDILNLSPTPKEFINQKFHFYIAANLPSSRKIY